MLLGRDVRRVSLVLLCLVASWEVSARKVDQIRLPSHTKVKYMPADHKKVKIYLETHNLCVHLTKMQFYFIFLNRMVNCLYIYGFNKDESST